MRKQLYFFLFSVASIAFSNVHAKQKHEASGQQPVQEHGIAFIENKGQWTKEIKFRADLCDGVFFLTDDGFVYNFAQGEDWGQVNRTASDTDKVRPVLLRQHAYRVHLEGSNKEVSYKPEQRHSTYHNYFIGKDPSSWKGHVGLFGRVTQGNIYNGIDLAVYSRDNRLKYDFIVAAGADVTQVRLRYEGVNPEITPEGNLRIKTSVNEIIEQAPVCFQIIDGKEHRVAARYAIKDNTITFFFPDGYDSSKPLIIDPEVVYATYSGAVVPAGNMLYYTPDAGATTYGPDGKLYAAASVHHMGWPVTMGAVQTVYNINMPQFIVRSDIGINVFSANGSQLIYSTYYGGENIEIPLTMIVNEQSELYLGGGTCSEDELPVTPGCYDSTYAGGASGGNLNGLDMFVAHFNATGTALLGATLLGGTGSELIPSSNSMTQSQPWFIRGEIGYNTGCPMNMALDQQGNIWIIGNTASTDFPVTANAQQAVHSGGPADIVLCKLNPACSQLLYSSFLGGNQFDLGYDILFNHAGNLVICGGTQSTNFPVTPGSFHTTYVGGGFDGFVSVINPANGNILKSTYLGTADKDQAIMVQVDKDNNVFTVGNTYGNYPVTQGTYSMPGGDVFLQKLNPDLSLSLASTVLGKPSPSRLRPAGFVFTDCGELLLSATMDRNQMALMPTTANAMMAASSQFWFCSLPADFSALSYASYYGPALAQGPLVPFLYWQTGFHRYDPAGAIYHSIKSYNSGFPTTAASWAPTTVLNSMPPISNQPADVVCFKINFGFNSDFVLDINANDSGCAPYTVQFNNSSLGANAYTWDFGDGSPVSNLAVPPPHTYINPGSYTVSLYASNDTACVTGDTAFMTITVVDVVQPDITVQDTLLCIGYQALDLTVQINNPNPGFAIQWTPPAGILSPSDQATITVNPTLNNTYYVTVTDDQPGLCSAFATDSIKITLAANLLSILTADTTVCQNTTIQVVATGNPLYTYRWMPSTGLSDSTILQPSMLVTQSENYMLLASYPGCPDTAVFLNVDMHYTPVVELGNDKSYCAGIEVALESLVSPYRNDYIYTWTPNTGNLSNPDGPNTHLTAEQTLTYTLTVQTPIGCSGSDSIKLIVFPGVEGGVTPDTGYCPANQLQLAATGGTNYNWTPSYGLNDTTISDPFCSAETTTDYTVVISNEYNCSDTQKVTVQVYSNAVLSMPDSVVVYPGEQYHLEPGTNCLYFAWFPPSGINDIQSSDPVFDPEVRTRYFVTATTEHGCVVKDSIDILPKETVIDIPNAFVPGSTNNRFKPSIRGIATLKAFDIFNRWGNKVYSGTDINEGWDGTYNGTPQPAGVYVYMIKASTDSGQIFIRQGNVTLLR